MRIAFLLLAAACATSGSAGSGTIAIKAGANYAARPVTYSVGKGVITSSDLDARVDDGCVRGVMRGTPIQFCSDPANPDHWTGASGDFTAVRSSDGRNVSVDGYISLDAGRQIAMTQVIPLGQGPQWDELRRNPALLAIAATAADLTAAHIRH
jgi:hypothetical protein